METSTPENPTPEEPEFFYIIRHPDGHMVGTQRTTTKYGNNAMLGAYKLELTSKAYYETLEVFGCLEDLEVDEVDESRVNWPVNFQDIKVITDEH